jgi:hypothetical protein
MINGSSLPGQPGDFYFFDGVIDGVAVFNKALSAERGRAHYEAENLETPIQPPLGAFSDIHLDDTGQVVITWDGAGEPQQATSALGPFENVVRANSPHQVEVETGVEHYYRLRQ